MQQGGPPHGNQPMGGGGYMPPNQQQQQPQQGMGQQMNYYQQQNSGQYNQMGMQMNYQGPPSVPGSANMGQPSSMSAQHNVGPSLGGSQALQSMGQAQSAQQQASQPQPTSSQQPPSQHSGMMPQQPIYGQQNAMGDFGGRPQYMPQTYGNMPPQAASQVPIGQHQGIQQQINPQSNPPSLPQPVHQPNIPQGHQPHHQPLSQQHPPQAAPLTQPGHQQPAVAHGTAPSIYSGGLGSSIAPKSYNAPSSSSAAPAQPGPPGRTPRRNVYLVSYSPEVLSKLQNYSVGALCNVARELIHELNHKTVTISTLLKPVDKKHLQNVNQDIDQLVDYCLMLFDKLAEIRVIIDRRLGEPNTKPEEFLKSFEDPSDPPDIRPELLRQKLYKFKDNAKRIVDLSHDMKLLDWMGTVSDPSQLKKVDKMSCSSQNPPPS